MADPITWRNVNGPSNADVALAGFRSAGNSLGGAFDAFSNILKGRENTQAANVGVQNEVEKQNYLDALGQAKTPEEMAALQQSGQLDQMRASLSAANRAAVRNADEARLMSVRQQTTAGQAYADAQLDHEQAPIRDQVGTLAAQGKKDEALALLAANPNLRNAAELSKAIVSGDRAALEFHWKGNQEQRAESSEGRAADSFKITNRTAQLGLDAAEQAASDTKTTRKMEDKITAAAASRTANINGMKSIIAEEADKLGKLDGADIPRNSDGSVNVDRLTTKQRTAFDAHLDKFGLPPLKEVSEGDTQAAAGMVAKLKADGYRASDIAKSQGLIDSQFSTTPIATIGNDAATLERNSRIRDAQLAADKNQFAGVATPGSENGVLDKVLDGIGKIYEPGSWKHKTARIAVSNFLGTGGIIVKDDKGNPIVDPETKVPVRVLPSPETISRIVAGAQDRWYSPAGSNYVEEALQKWADNPENIAGAAKLYNQDVVTKIRAIDKPEIKK